MNGPSGDERLKKYNNKEESGSFAGYSDMAGSTEIAFTCGCTACVVLIVGNKVYCANAGDSRSVLSRSGKSVALSFDHKPSNPEEEKRIK
jgi:serine/threonine protein phosphatase PrpC